MLSFLRSFCYTSACCSNAAPLRASSSAGQSWRLITAWSRVQVLPGPPQSTKVSAFVLLFCSFIQFLAHLAANLFAPLVIDLRVDCKSGTLVFMRVFPMCTNRPACRLQEWYWAVRVRLLRLPLPHRYWGSTTKCWRRCAGTYADGFSRLGVHITEHMIRWPFLFAPIAADPAFCRKLHQIPPFAQ